MNSPYDPHNYDDFYAQEYGGYGGGGDDNRRQGGPGGRGPRGPPRGPMSEEGNNISYNNVYCVFIMHV